MNKFLLSHQSIISDFGMTFLMLVIVSGIASLFYRLNLADATIILLYLLGAMVLALFIKRRVFGILFSLVSVLTFNYLFTYPRFTFHSYDRNHLATFLILFIASLLASALAAKLKESARASRQDAYSTQILLNASQQLAKAKDAKQAYYCAAMQLNKLTEAGILIYPYSQDQLKEPIVYGMLTQEMYDQNVEKVLKKGAYAGLVDFSNRVYVPIHLDDKIFGIAGIEIEKKKLGTLEENIILSILGETSMALENLESLIAKQKADMKAEKERLRFDLLRMISHDLRTPLTSIYGNAQNLLQAEDSIDPANKKQIYTDIYEDSKWLIDLVENLLAITRLDQDNLDLHFEEEIVEDVIEEAIARVDSHKREHVIEIEESEEILTARMDARLIVQVLVNLINNAIKYTPSGSHIHIQTQKKEGWVLVSVGDDGPGISDAMKEHVFEMFYTGNKAVMDSRRSLGLGLALCKSVIEAHGGTLSVKDNIPHGAVFTFSLPTGGIHNE